MFTRVSEDDSNVLNTENLGMASDSGNNSHKETHKKRKNDDRTKNKSQSKVGSNIETNAKKKKVKKRKRKPSKDKSLAVRLNNFGDNLLQVKPTFGASKTSNLPECRPGTYAVKEGTQTNGIGEGMTADRRTVVHQTVSEAVQRKKADSCKERVEKDLTPNRNETAATSRGKD